MLVGLVAVALALVFAVAMIFRSAGNSPKSSISAPTAAGRTPTAGATKDVISGPAAKATSSVNVRDGPGNGYIVLGVLRRGSEAKIVGRNDDGDWLEIEYPANSNLLGWIIATSVDTSADLATIPISTPESLPMAIVPTQVPVTFVPDTPEGSTTVTPTAAAGAALPDLVVSGTLISGGTLVVTVTNQGKAALKTTTIEVGIFDASGAQLKLASVAVQSLNAGQSIDVQTGYIALMGPTELLVIVDPNGKINESDNTNNRLVVSLSPTATPTEAPVATMTAIAPPATPTPHA